jgi:hypothetical protein
VCDLETSRIGAPYIYDIGHLRVNEVEPDRPQMKILCMCVACWIPKATNTQEYVILLVFYWNSGGMNASQCYVASVVGVCLFLRHVRNYDSRMDHIYN